MCLMLIGKIAKDSQTNLPFVLWIAIADGFAVYWRELINLMLLIKMTFTVSAKGIIMVVRKTQKMWKMQKLCCKNVARYYFCPLCLLVIMAIFNAQQQNKNKNICVLIACELLYCSSFRKILISVLPK